MVPTLDTCPIWAYSSAHPSSGEYVHWNGIALPLGSGGAAIFFGRKFCVFVLDSCCVPVEWRSLGLTWFNATRYVGAPVFAMKFVVLIYFVYTGDHRSDIFPIEQLNDTPTAAAGSILNFSIY
jgi:hypothetical protein